MSKTHLVIATKKQGIFLKIDGLAWASELIHHSHLHFENERSHYIRCSSVVVPVKAKQTKGKFFSHFQRSAGIWKVACMLREITSEVAAAW